MIKRIFLFSILLTILFLISYFPHRQIINSPEQLSYSLLSVYLFHFIAAIIVYLVIELVANYLPTQAGYAYLASIFLKIGFFVLIFKAPIFDNDNLSQPERISLVVPLFLFLITEAIGVSKLLNNLNLKN